MLYTLGLLREAFYIFKISLNKSKRITYKKTRIISDRNGINKPEDLIKYIKYYACTETSWYPDWKRQINQYSKIPELVLIDTIDKIQYSYERKIYLEWLINELSSYPVNGTFDIHEIGYFKDFKKLALDKYKLCLDQPNTLDQESTHDINRAPKSSDNRGKHNKPEEIMPEEMFWDVAANWKDPLTKSGNPKGELIDALETAKFEIDGERRKLVGYKRKDKKMETPQKLTRPTIRRRLNQYPKKWL